VHVTVHLLIRTLWKCVSYISRELNISLWPIHKCWWRDDISSILLTVWLMFPTRRRPTECRPLYIDYGRRSRSSSYRSLRPINCQIYITLNYIVHCLGVTAFSDTVVHAKPDKCQYTLCVSRPSCLMGLPFSTTGSTQMFVPLYLRPSSPACPSQTQERTRLTDAENSPYPSLSKSYVYPPISAFCIIHHTDYRCRQFTQHKCNS